jgi:hypothetical protein
VLDIRRDQDSAADQFGDAERSKAVVAKNPERFVWFVGVDMTKPDALAILRKNLAVGAMGLGEMKSHVACASRDFRPSEGQSEDYGYRSRRRFLGQHQRRSPRRRSVSHR